MAVSPPPVKQKTETKKKGLFDDDDEAEVKPIKKAEPVQKKVAV